MTLPLPFDEEKRQIRRQLRKRWTYNSHSSWRSSSSCSSSACSSNGSALHHRQAGGTFNERQIQKEREREKEPKIERGRDKERESENVLNKRKKQKLNMHTSTMTTYLIRPSSPPPPFTSCLQRFACCRKHWLYVRCLFRYIVRIKMY